MEDPDTPLLAEIPPLGLIVNPGRTEGLVRATDRWVAQHGRQIAIVLCLALSAFLIVRGLARSRRLAPAQDRPKRVMRVQDARASIRPAALDLQRRGASELISKQFNDPLRKGH